jgi:cytochrome c-type biogenesis protein CcmE
MRVGGLVEEGSLWRGENLTVRFALTDGSHEVTVSYRGQLPDLFREGQGVVRRALSTATARSRPIRFWPNMTSAICPRKWPMP